MIRMTAIGDIRDGLLAALRAKAGSKVFDAVITRFEMEVISDDDVITIVTADGEMTITIAVELT